MKTFIRFLICAVFVCALTGVTAYAAAPSSYTPISLDTNYTCNCSSTGVTRYYAYTPSTSGSYTFYSTGSYDTYGQVLDSNGNQLAYSDDNDGDSNFRVVYNLNAGTKYYFSARLYYNSTQTGSFTVILTKTKPQITASDIDYDTYRTYTGYAINPINSIVVDGKTLVQGTDYTVSFSNNVNTGYYDAEFTVTGIGNYSGSVTKSFCIDEESINNCTITFNSAYYYSGSAVCPNPVIKNPSGKTLVKGTDYNISYDDNDEVGTGEAYIYGIGNYDGSTYKYFTIKKKIYKLSASNITLNKTSVEYFYGYARTVGVTVKYGKKTLRKGTDYKVSYANHRNVGKATVTVTGIGFYSGTFKKQFTIKPKKVVNYYIDNMTYNGKSRIPAVWIDCYTYDSEDEEFYRDCKKLVNGKDYTIKVSGNHKSIGQYTATVKFKGNYTGTVKKKYKILPARVSKVKTKPISTKEIQVSWNKVKGATGYVVYRYNNKSREYKFYKKTTGTSMRIKDGPQTDGTVYFYIKTYKKVGKKTYNSENYWYDFEYLKPTAPSYTISRTDFGEFYTYFSRTDNYQVQVSNNKNFSNSGYGNYVKSWKYKNIDYVHFYNWSSGTKYYIRARRFYYDKHDNLKVGPWSKVKTVVPY